MKKYIILLSAVLSAGTIQAQEYKLAKSTGRLDIQEVNNVSIEGYAGSEIVFSSLDGRNEKDSRAVGLKRVNSMGLEDNTGIGIAVVDKGTTYEVYQLKKMDGPRVKILVPKGVTISYRHSSPHGSDLKLKNIENEVEVSTVHNGIQLENATGPLNIKTVHGDIEADFTTGAKSPVYLSSTHGLVDVSLPGGLRVNMNMSTSHGEIFVDPGLNLEIPKTGDWVKYGSNKVDGKINGGGLEFTLSSGHGNVYLRKKQ